MTGVGDDAVGRGSRSMATLRQVLETRSCPPPPAAAGFRVSARVGRTAAYSRPRVQSPVGERPPPAFAVVVARLDVEPAHSLSATSAPAAVLRQPVRRYAT